jgi:acyl carrier protein phosphodiesterase
MNYLAHLFLSYDIPHLIIGNLAGDAVKGNEWQNFAVPIQNGILLHREIDHFTDNHPAIRAMINRIRPKIGKYSGPVMDILCDHFLAKNWQHFHDKPIQEWSNQVYQIIIERADDLPESIRERFLNMAAHNWLMGYDQRKELEYVMNRFNRRLKIPLDVEAVSEAFFGKDYAFYQEQFMVFFPEIIEFTKDFLHQKQEFLDLP